MLIGIIVLVVMFPSGDPMLSCNALRGGGGGGVVTHLSPTVVLHNLYFRCSGHAHSRAAKEEKKAKLIWEGYKRRHKGEIPPKVDGADGGGRCAGTIDTALLCAVWPFPYVNHTLLLQKTRLRCKVCVFAVVGGIRCVP